MEALRRGRHARAPKRGRAPQRGALPHGRRVCAAAPRLDQDKVGAEAVA
eukprot:CAMPEP_0118843394 /NCGR_PEP_ID=MMETSP1162-20130426/82431_1 /TAXON_ID=33656 /ORGANISM="Phaeocystis Sp, Strain CCMP2710" /LENGTH=48 /DNA_ID= /DNA_START= /DNA_END= /DNA_ORIENTATION=